MKTLKIFCILLFTSLSYTAAEAQIDTTTYHLTIEQQPVNITGKSTRGMTINGSIPGPTLRFKEGGYAVIRVTNRMDVETSVHWHGLLLPNYYDGVPYLTTPPIAPGETLQYEFPLKQAGTYWYHSHTMLQEQRGVYGSIVIEPQEKTIDYDRDLVLVFSDWTDEKPANVLRNLKRGNEWYNIRKGTATPLNRVIARGAFGAQLNFWKQRMEGADIADIYYPAFLVNGEMTREYPEFKPGEKVRLRIINAAASTSFWLTFGGEDPVLVAADGLDVVPVTHNKTFIAIAETYDYIVEVPANGKLEVRATAQDGSGQTAAFLGNGPTLSAPDVPRPDKIGMMMQMAKMNMKMGAPALKFRPGRDNRFQMKDKYGMQMEGMDHSPADMQQHEMEQMPGMDHQRDHPKDTMPMPEKGKTSQMQMQESHQHQDTMPMPDMDRKEGMDSAGMQMEGMPGMNMFAEYNYDYLRSPEPTAFADTTPVKEILLNLTGNMNRYIWSMNGVALSETDKIKIKGDQVTRIRLNNLTMMH
ncbi:MAG: multicopper oxidase domain-containing protein, partial [Lewinella sp.]|nr:multicopper oxidase domain-containing protein [Lewinella sp.]